MAAHHRGEQPCADDVVALRPQVHREYATEQVAVAFPIASDLWCQRRRCPCVHHVGFANETVGLAALRLSETGRHIRRRIDRQRLVAGHEHLVEDRARVGVESIPQRQRHTEVALSADQPVAFQASNPVAVATLHVRRVPGEFAAALDECVAEAFVAATVTDVPLARGNNFERTLAALVELHRVLDLAWLADHFARGCQHLGDGALRLLRVEPGDLLVRGTPSFGRDPRRHFHREATIETD